jgi:hypothetical protein
VLTFLVCVPQVVVIGDARANTKQEVDKKRGDFGAKLGRLDQDNVGETYWSKTRFKQASNLFVLFSYRLHVIRNMCLV